MNTTQPVKDGSMIYTNPLISPLVNLKLFHNTDWKTVEVNGEDVEIPLAWSVKNLGDICNFINGSAFKPSDWCSDQSGYKIVRIQNLSNPNAAFNFTKKTPKEFVSIDKNDLLMSWSGTIDIYRWDKGFSALNQHIFKVEVKNSNNLFTEIVLRNALSQLKDLAHGATMVHIRKEPLNNFEICLPSIAEQNLMATVLDAKDKRLIDLKQQSSLQRKRLDWLTEELLSGRIRVEEDVNGQPTVLKRDEQGNVVDSLPAVKLVTNTDWKTVEVNGEEVEIPQEWEVSFLKDLAQLQKGKNLTRKDAAPGNIPVVAGGKSPSGYHNVANREKNIITVSASGANAGYVAFYNQPIFATDCTTILANKNVVQRFVFLYLKHKQNEITMLQQGAAQPHVYASDLNFLSITTPPFKEQTLIAQTLTAQEEYIASLDQMIAIEEKRLAWLTDELLSGRILIQEVK